MEVDTLEEARTTVVNLAKASTDYQSSLSDETSLILEDLREIQAALNDLQVRCKLECLEIEKKYNELRRPLLEKLGNLISGGTQSLESFKEDQPQASEDAPVGIPNFWHSALNNHLAFHDLIEEHDQDALDHLVDIRLEYLSGTNSKPGHGYTILFEFSPNDYFENKVLSKTYQCDGTKTGSSGDLVYSSATGTAISWKKGMDLTQRANGDLRFSFFHFFSPLTMQEIEEAEKEGDEDWLAMIDDQIEEDYQLGAALRDQILLHPVDWFMGTPLREACGPSSASMTMPETVSRAVKHAPRYGYKATMQSIVQNASTELAWSLLFLGARHGYASLVELLIARHGKSVRIDINSKDEEGRTPLYVAAREGHGPIVELLVGQHDIDVNLSKTDGATPLFIAAWNGHEEVVKVLLGHRSVKVNACTHGGETPLFAAAQNGHESVVKLLLNHDGVDVNYPLKTGATPLYVAARNGHESVVKLLLEVEGIHLNAHYQDGSTPLFVAVQNDHLAVVNLLVSQKGINVNLSKNNGATPLYVAANAGSVAMVQALIGIEGIDLTVRSHGMTPYLIAVKKGHRDIARLLEPNPTILRPLH